MWLAGCFTLHNISATLIIGPALIKRVPDLQEMSESHCLLVNRLII